MEIRNHVPVPLSATPNADSATSDQKTDQLVPMSTFMKALKLEPESESDEAQMRSYLREALNAMPKETEKEVISALKALAGNAADTDVGALIDTNLPEVEKETQKGNGIDRLLELLFMLMLVLGQTNTARNKSAAKFGEISIKQAAASGDKIISGAQMMVYGAVSGMALGAAIAVGGYYKFAKGSNRQIKNIGDNNRTAIQLRDQNSTSRNTIGRQASPLDGASPQERVRDVKVKDQLARLQENQPGINGGEREVVSRPLIPEMAQTDSIDVLSQQNQIKGQQQIHAGYLISGQGQTIAQIAMTGGQFAQSAQTAASKVNEAQGGVASSLQRNEEQTAQRSVELLMKIFSLIATTTEQSRSTLDSISQSIRA